MKINFLFVFVFKDIFIRLVHVILTQNTCIREMPNRIARDNPQLRFYGFTLSLQVNAEIVGYLTVWLPSSKSLTTHHI